MNDFDAIFARLRRESEIPRLFDAMIRSIGEIISDQKIEPTLVRDAMRRLKDLLEANRDGSYVSLCGVLWNLKFYKVAIGNLISQTQHGKALLAQIDEFDKEEKKRIRPKLMRRSARLLTNQKQLETFRQVNSNAQLQLPGSDQDES